MKNSKFEARFARKGSAAKAEFSKQIQMSNPKIQKFLVLFLVLILFPFFGVAKTIDVSFNLDFSLNLASLEDIAKKVITIAASPYTLTKLVKEKIEAVEVKLPQQLASLLENNESGIKNNELGNRERIVEVKPQQPSVIAIRQLAEKQSQIQDTKYIIQNTKEIIREVIVKEISSPIQDTKYSIQDTDIGDKLTALRTELTDSFTKRINTLVGGFGFNTNRFDDLFVQKSLELAGKLNQPASVASSPITFSSSITSKDISATSLALSSVLTVSGTATSTISGPLKIAGGLTAGSGNVQIIDSTGKIPALSSTYFATLPNIFASIGNASSTVQFSANQFQDTLSFEATGGLLTISFDSTNKKITFSASAPTLLSVLNQGADASTFTGTTKIAGLTVDSSGNITAGAWQGTTIGGVYGGTGFSSFSAGDLLYASATTTLSRLVIGDTNRVLTSSGSLPQWSNSLTLGGTLTVQGSASSTITGPLIAGSGNVEIIDATGKIPALSSTYLASLSGANLTSLSASNITSGNINLATAGPQKFTAADSQIFLGTGTDPGWTRSAVQIGGRAAVWTGGSALTLTSNVYDDGSSRYIAADTAGQIQINGSAITLSTAPSGTVGNAITFTQAFTTADPGLVAIGRSASIDGNAAYRAILTFGANSTTAYDRTVTDGGNLAGAAINPSLRMADVGGSTFPSLLVEQAILADGVARTLTNAILIFGRAFTKDANVTVTNAFTVDLNDPTIGGTLNRTIRALSGAYLTTGGLWTNASSRDYKIVLGRNTPEDYPTRITELRDLDPVYYRHKPDHLIHPLRTSEDLEKYNKENNKDYKTLDEANAAGIATDARFNEATGEYEAYRFGRWEQVGSDSKPTIYGILAEELPELIRTKDSKGFDLGAGIAWLIGTSRASLNKIDQASNADYAEWTRVVGDPSSYEPGDLLMFSKEDRKVEKAKGGSDPPNALMGVVSLNPGPVGFSYDITSDITSGITDKSTEQIEKEFNAKMVATIGYTPIKVSTENGPLSPGDPITISSTPGVGRKAKGGEKIIGYTMESFDPANGKMGTNDIDLPTRTYNKFFHPMTKEVAEVKLQQAAGSSPSQHLWQGWVFGYVNLGYVGNDLNVGIMNNELGIKNEPVIDKNGNQLALTHEGTVVIKRLVVKDLELAKDATFTAPAGENQVTGKATVPEGLTYSIVENTGVHPRSHIFLTLNSRPQDIQYAAVNIEEGQFTIQLSKGAPHPLTFFYWVLDTYDAGAIKAESTAVPNASTTTP